MRVVETTLDLGKATDCKSGDHAKEGIFTSFFWFMKLIIRQKLMSAVFILATDCFL